MFPKIAKILAALLALRLVLMVFVPVFEPSEARYAALAANMARTGDFIVPSFTYKGVYQSFDGKPPLVFQAGGLACRALGTESPQALQLGVRLFPLASALVLLAILYFEVRRTDGPDAAVLALAVCATTTAFAASAGIAMTDMTLTCCVAGALLLYRRFADTRLLGAAAGVAALLGAGMVTKGPVALALFGLPVVVDAALNRRWDAFLNVRWLAVAPVFLLVAVPWFVLVERRNPGSVWYFFYNENFLRFVTRDYGDRYGAGREAFRGAALVWVLVATLPWALVPLAAAARLVRRTAADGARAVLSALGRAAGLRTSFAGLACAVIVAFWCLTSRVLLYYLFPVIPLFAAWLVQRADRRRLARCVPWAAGATALVLVGALAGGALLSDKMLGPRAPYEPHRSRYAYEFYHGTPKSALKAAALLRAAEARPSDGRK